MVWFSPYGLRLNRFSVRLHLSSGVWKAKRNCVYSWALAAFGDGVDLWICLEFSG